MNLQDRYERMIKDAHAFCAQSLSKLDHHDLPNRVDTFMQQHGVDEESDSNDKFTSDLVRKLRKVAVTHSKESVSKLVHFLEKCPERYENYRE